MCWEEGEPAQASLRRAHHHRRETAACWTVEDNSRRHRLKIHKSLQCALNSSKYAAHDIDYILKLLLNSVAIQNLTKKLGLTRAVT